MFCCCLFIFYIIFLFIYFVFVLFWQNYHNIYLQAAFYINE